MRHFKMSHFFVSHFFYFPARHRFSVKLRMNLPQKVNIAEPTGMKKAHFSIVKQEKIRILYFEP